MNNTRTNEESNKAYEQKFQLALQKLKGLKTLNINEIIMLMKHSGYSTNVNNLLTRDDINALIIQIEKLIYRVNPSKKFIKYLMDRTLRFDMIHPSILNCISEVVDEKFALKSLYKTTDILNTEYPIITLDCIDYYKSFIKNHIDTFIFIKIYSGTLYGGWYNYSSPFSRNNDYFVCKLLVYYILTNRINDIEMSENMLSKVLLRLEGTEVTRALKEIQAEREDLFNSKVPIENTFELIEYLCNHDFFDFSIKDKMIEKKLKLKSDIHLDEILNNPNILFNIENIKDLSKATLLVTKSNKEHMNSIIDTMIAERKVIQLVRLLALSKLNRRTTFTSDSKDTLSIREYMLEYLANNKDKVFEVFIDYFLKERLSIKSDKFIVTSDSNSKYDKIIPYCIGYVFYFISNKYRKANEENIFDALVFVKNITILTESLNDDKTELGGFLGLYNSYFDLIPVMTYYGIKGYIYEDKGNYPNTILTDEFKDTTKNFYTNLLYNENYLSDPYIDDIFFIIKHSERDFIRKPFFFHINNRLITSELNNLSTIDDVIYKICKMNITNNDDGAIDKFFLNLISNVVITTNLMKVIMNEKVLLRNLMRDYLFRNDNSSDCNRITLTENAMKLFISMNNCNTHLRDKYNISLCSGVFNFLKYVSEVEPLYKLIGKKIFLDGYNIYNAVESLNSSIYSFNKYEIDENGNEKVRDNITRDHSRHNTLRQATDLGNKGSYYFVLSDIEKIILKVLPVLLSEGEKYVVIKQVENVFKLYHCVFDDAIFTKPCLSKIKNGFVFLPHYKIGDNNSYYIERGLKELLSIYVSMIKNNSPTGLGKTLLRDLMLRMITGGRYRINNYNEIKELSSPLAYNKDSVVGLPKNMNDFDKIKVLMYDGEDITLKDLYDMCEFLSPQKEELESLWNEYNFNE